MPVVHHLVADTFGSHVGKYSERIKITHKGKALQQAPLIHLQSVTLVGGGISISVDAIAACTERGIPILMLDGSGRVFASIYASGLIGTVLTRREQLLAYSDQRGLQLAVTFAWAKVSNQARTLAYWARNRRADHPDDAVVLADAAATLQALADELAAVPLDQPADRVRSALMGYEGAAAAAYWHAADRLVPERYGWPGREGRGAVDPVNSLLNYGYGMLYGEVERAIIMAGLDPYAGFLHADRPGKPSLVLDLIEEFRQIVVDRLVFGLIARGYHVKLDDTGLLTQATRSDFAKRILHQLEGRTRYEDGRHQIRHIIQRQARHLAASLRGERTYAAFVIAE
ncbi:MAG: CRISPR-associated endonuclease Cas1 [Aggregatilineales bacterium]